MIRKLIWADKKWYCEAKAPASRQFYIPNSRALFLLDLEQLCWFSYIRNYRTEFEYYWAWVTCRDFVNIDYVIYKGNSQDLAYQGSPEVVLPRIRVCGQNLEQYLKVWNPLGRKFTQRALYLLPIFRVCPLAWIHVGCGDLRTNLGRISEVNLIRKACIVVEDQQTCPPTMASLDSLHNCSIPTNGFIAQYPQMIQQQQPRLPEEGNTDDLEVIQSVKKYR